MQDKKQHESNTSRQTTQTTTQHEVHTTSYITQATNYINRDISFKHKHKSQLKTFSFTVSSALEI